MFDEFQTFHCYVLNNPACCDVMSMELVYLLILASTCRIHLEQNNAQLCQLYLYLERFHLWYFTVSNNAKSELQVSFYVMLLLSILLSIKFFPLLVFWSGNFFLIAPFPDHYLV